MDILALLSRIAFICNICLLLAWSLRYSNFIPGVEVRSTVIIAGLVLSFIMNGLVNLMYAILLMRKRKLREFVPIWLAVLNFLFLILQLYLILVK